ncbi:MAG: hypothetical protein QMC67_14535 [Candidatus Wallbacteria bacterium]
MSKKSLFLVFIFYLTLIFSKITYANEFVNLSKLYCKDIIPGITCEKDVLDSFKNLSKKTINSDKTYTYYFKNPQNENHIEIVTLSSKGKVKFADLSSSDLKIRNITEVKKIIGEPSSTKNLYFLKNIFNEIRNDRDYSIAMYPNYGFLFMYSKHDGAIKRACYFEKSLFIK